MKTAVLVHDTNISDLNYHVMSELNNMSNTHEVFLLTNNISSRVIEPNFAIINSSRVACTYDAIVIATTIDTARLLIKAAINSRKVFYLYQLDWLYLPFNYNEVYDVINSDLELIVRSKNHANLIEKVFGRKVDNIVPEFRLDEIWNLLENTKND